MDRKTAHAIFQEENFTRDDRSQRCSDWLSAQVRALACDPVLLTEAQRASKKLGTGELGLEVAGLPIQSATTSAEILVSAVQGALLSNDTFANSAWKPGQRIHITVTEGDDGPTVLADGQRPRERTITERATPATLNRVLRATAPHP